MKKRAHYANGSVEDHMIVYCMTVAQSEMQSHCGNKIFVMQYSNLTLGPYFTNAKNQKRQNKKQKNFH